MLGGWEQGQHQQHEEPLRGLSSSPDTPQPHARLLPLPQSMTQVLDIEPLLFILRKLKLLVLVHQPHLTTIGI